jgi:hypothetical protein
LKKHKESINSTSNPKIPISISNNAAALIVLSIEVGYSVLFAL